MKEINNPIIIVGMARSGTTLITHVLGSKENVHMEIEPHALWKSGNFKYLNDQEYDLKPESIKYIRNAMLSAAGSKRLIEKSPPNCIRPELVYAVFPDAKLVYVERNPAKCIGSNHKRSLSNDSFKFSIILKKYFKETGSDDLPGAMSKRGLFQQIRISDLFYFIRYILFMLWLRQVRNLLPFGTKLNGFWNIVKTKGDLQYQIDVFNFAKEKKSIFKKFYGDEMQSFRMEKIMTDSNEIKRLFDFVGFKYTEDEIQNIMSSFSPKRVEKALTKTASELKIEEAYLQ